MDFDDVQVFRSAPRSGSQSISVIEFGKQKVSALIKDRRLPCYAAVSVEKGRGSLTSEFGGTQAIIGPALFWLLPGQRHSYGPDIDTVWHERWVLFQGQLVEDFRRERFIDPVQPVIALAKYAEVSNVFNALHADIMRADVLGAASAAVHIQRLIVQMALQQEKAKSSHNTGADGRLAGLIEERAFSDLDLTALASELQVSPATLRRKAVGALGMAPKHYQLQLRIDRAKELLAGTTQTVADIARNVGYEDSFYFSRLFLKREGRSPTEFRKLHTRI